MRSVIVATLLWALLGCGGSGDGPDAGVQSGLVICCDFDGGRVCGTQVVCD